MTFLPFTRMWERVEIARDESDMPLFLNLLYLGEMMTKTVVAGITAAIVDDRQRNRYSAVYHLVRADGLGEWNEVLDDILTGPAAQFMLNASGDSQRELTQRNGMGTWQYESVLLLHKCLEAYDLPTDDLPSKVDGRRWFRYFTQLRNKSRAHGAPQSSKCSALCSDLEKSIRLFIDNYSLFKLPWAFLHRNFSGKYRVTKLTENIEPFEYLKTSTPKGNKNFADGVYIHFDQHIFVELLLSDPDAFDFFYPNGQFTDKKFELISYITETKREGDSSQYLFPVTELPDSETQGRGLLDIQGKCWGNLPPQQTGYVERPVLEDEVRNVLIDDRHPIVTLVGRGGIGKTWLALKVLHEISNLDRYEAILWFSARDIDLLPYGPKKVRPQILDEKDIAAEFAKLLQPAELLTKGFKPLDYLTENLQESRIGPLLFVFDNFETVKNPYEVYTWIDTYLRLPNKVLITTRFREFKADYPTEVSGMTEIETEALVNVTSQQLGIQSFITSNYKYELYQESEGHPYVIKILLGEVAKAKKQVTIQRILAADDEILNALFERTYTGFSPAARRVFLTLCNWRSIVPKLALEAVLLRPENEKVDVANAIDELVRSSFIEEYVSEIDNQVFLGLPLVTMMFGRRKLAVSPMNIAIEADTRLLRAFGIIQASGIPSGVAPSVDRLFRFVAENTSNSADKLDSYIPMLEYVASRYPIAWLSLASLFEESGIEGRLEKAKTAVQHYLETPDGNGGKKKAWKSLSYYCRRTQDSLGEAHALVEMSQLGNITLEEISDNANRINWLLKEGLLIIDSNEKQILIEKLISAFSIYLIQADATDCSRFAWLALHIQDRRKAIEYTEIGLQKDPQNPHIQKLSTTLQIY